MGVYAAKHKDDVVRAASRSGGAFTALSDAVLERNGVVFGCALDRGFNAHHTRAETKVERDEMRGSKYIQSDMGDTCGFKIKSEVTGVPKGSGLGTSSILCAACCKAILEFFGIGYTENEIISRVLKAEQIMSTGGGWQDQVGGLFPGIKLLTSEPGTNQQINIEKLELKKETLEELNERLAIVYTGQRRLARYLLRDVIGRYLSGEPDCLKAHVRIKEIAVEMAEALKIGDMDKFAELMDEHWNYSKMIDSDSSNALIESILESIDDLVVSKMVCGAGGGGFLQILKKRDVSNEQIHNRLKDCFGDTSIDVWNVEII